MRADDAKSFAAAIQRLRAILERPEVQEECAGDAERFLVEDFIPGIEVSVEGLVTEGGLHVLTLFDKPDPLDGPFFEETIYVTPSRLPRATQEAVTQATARATAALGIVSGPVHAELRINDDGIYPIDIAARSIGGLCARTLTFGTGMSLEEIILRQATGAPIDSFDREEQASGVMMIPIPRSGTLHEVEGIAAAEGVSGVSEVTISIRVGRPVLALPEGAEYLGFIFARADTPEEVESALREAHQRLRFQIR
jgi:biotin carboxylase